MTREQPSTNKTLTVGNAANTYSGTISGGGTFAGYAQGSTFIAGGQQFQISYFDIAGNGTFELTGGNDISLLAVPEPNVAVTLLGGVAMLLGLRRRRRA